MAEDLIRQGRVRVDGTIARVGQKVDPDRSMVEIDGTPLPDPPVLVYYLLNKPPGVISSAHDPHGRKTVVDLVPGDARIYPVGRLDANSEGLVLLTNDGRLANLVTHPRYGVEKTYIAHIDGRPTAHILWNLLKGVQLADGLAAATRIRLDTNSEGQSVVELVMREGRKHEVRRMFAALGHNVIRLRRTAIGPIRKCDLPQGAWRHLADTEVQALYGAVSHSRDREAKLIERSE